MKLKLLWILGLVFVVGCSLNNYDEDELRELIERQPHIKEYISVYVDCSNTDSNTHFYYNCEAEKCVDLRVVKNNITKDYHFQQLCLELTGE